MPGPCRRHPVCAGGRENDESYIDRKGSSKHPSQIQRGIKQVCISTYFRPPKGRKQAPRHQRRNTRHAKTKAAKEVVRGIGFATSAQRAKASPHQRTKASPL